MVVNIAKILAFIVKKITKQKIIKAFTLAEVLIVVGIIGIIAEVTIPILVQDFQEKANITQLRRTYSILGQAYTLARQENGEVNTWRVTCMNDVANIFVPYLQTVKVITPANSDYGNTTQMGYTTNLLDLRKNLTGTPMHAQIQLKSGEMLWFTGAATPSSGLTCSSATGSGWSGSCFFIMADTNGLKGPNRFGVDVFMFNASLTSISPFGGANSIGTGWKFCDPSTDITPWGSIPNGAACGAWVLQNNNMDYLKCIDGGDTNYCHSYKIN